MVTDTDHCETCGKPCTKVQTPEEGTRGRKGHSVAERGICQDELERIGKRVLGTKEVVVTSEKCRVNSLQDMPTGQSKYESEGLPRLMRLKVYTLEGVYVLETRMCAQCQD